MPNRNILYVKNMVCPRCIKVVREEFDKLGVKYKTVFLGEIETLKKREQLPIKQIAKVLEENGFELIEDSKSKIIESIKNEIISSIQQYEEVDLENVNFSKLLSKKTGNDYHYLSSLFSKVEGITIEHYIILQKIEKAKEFLKYGELTLSEIAYRLGYSSVQHLSRQFKKATGMTASQFKKDHVNHRKGLDSIRD